MLIGILSDTHDQVERTRRAVELLARAGAERLIHCGDITIPDVIYEMAQLPSYFVFGNCDFELDVLRRAMVEIGATCLEGGGVIEVGGRRLGVTHGHSHREWAALEAQQLDYVFSGHTHAILDQVREGTRYINPGALHRASRWTVALLDLTSGRLKSLVLPERTSGR